MTQEVHFSDIKKIIIKNLQSSNYDVKIAVAWLTDEKIISVINNLLIGGITVSIIIYDDHINRKELYEKLYYNKAKILLSKKLMHNKFCIIDNKTIINGSYNWTNNAKINDENIQITHNNEILATNFVDEFDKISKNCKSIDEHYLYSNTNLKNIENEFESYLLKRSKYKFPYFIDLKNFLPTKINSKFEINGFIYLIKNKIEEKNFLWYYFLSQSNFSAIKILNFRNEKVFFPTKFNAICLNKKNHENVIEFLDSKITVEENLTQHSTTKYYLFSINREGEKISEKIEFTYRVSDQSYLYVNNDASYFIDYNLDKKVINYNVEKVITIKDEFNQYRKAKLLVISELKNGEKKFGLMDINKSILIPVLYDTYSFDKIFLNDFKDLYIDFTEFPVLEEIYVNSQKFISIPNFDKKQTTGTFAPFIDRIIYRYSIENYQLIEKFFLSKDNFKRTYTSSYFLSDENYRYKDFYLKVANIKFEIPKMQYDFLYKINLKLTIEEFNELKNTYNDNYKFQILTKKYESIRKNKQLKKELEAKKINEGGCYIATMVYGNYDHPDVLVLRNFRDNFINKFLIGRIFIKYYYKYSPKYVRVAKYNFILQIISKKIIFNLVKLLKN